MGIKVESWAKAELECDDCGRMIDTESDDPEAAKERVLDIANADKWYIGDGAETILCPDCFKHHQCEKCKEHEDECECEEEDEE